MSSTRARVEHLAERTRRGPAVRAIVDSFEWEQRSGAGLLAGGLAYARARWYLLAAGVLLAGWAGLAGVRALRVAAIIAWRLDPYRLRRPLQSSGAFAAVAVVGLSV